MYCVNACFHPHAILIAINTLNIAIRVTLVQEISMRTCIGMHAKRDMRGIWENGVG